MILVVADTSPLRYLVEINCQHLLPILFHTIWIPTAVLRELQQQKTSPLVREWAQQLPSWTKIPERNNALPANLELAGLDQGEREAIQLAQ